jgi:hypothetical protein
MFGSLWFIWFAFMFMFLLAPIGYGWGYRGWGVPYPSYVQRRRAQLAGNRGTAFDHQAWGRGGDIVWLVIIVGSVWALSAVWWR